MNSSFPFFSLVGVACFLVACGSTDSGKGDAKSDMAGSSEVVLAGDSFLQQDGNDPVGKDEQSQPSDAAADAVAECVDADRMCFDEQELAECQNGKWVLINICPGTHVCDNGSCVKLESCEPGDINGCYSLTAQKKCNPGGTAYVPVDCPEGEKCADGFCGEFECMPGQSICVDNKTKQTCLQDGSGYDEPTPCPTGLTCVGGKCLSQCLTDPKWNNSYIGCEYWTVDLDNYHDPFSSTAPDEAIHGLVLGNPGTAMATVTFTSFATDVAFNLLQTTIEPGQTRVVEMPRMDVDGSTISTRSVRVNSNRPIVAYQYNPLDFQAAYSDDSSLLIPAEMLGNEYLILTYGTSPLEAMPLGDFASQHGYFAVIAVEEGITNVSVRVSAVADKPDAEGEFLTPGPYYNFELEQGNVLNLQGDGSQMMKINDLSGSHVTADKRIAVFSGHEEAVVAAPGQDCCCAEHLEEQLFPLDTWANKYICVKAKPRGGPDVDLWRVQAGKANVKLITNPPIAGIDGVTLAQKGDWVEAYTADSFIVEGDGPIQVAQYFSSQGCTDEFIGDPALIMAVSQTQYRTPYAFAAPQDYVQDWITVIKPVGSTVILDTNNLDEGAFTPLAGGEFEFGYFEVQDGPHFIEGTEPFGLYQYGFDGPASYGHSGGLNLFKTQ
jgi:hypothetical protein